MLVIDAVIPPGNDPHPSKALDMFMMAMLTGMERTEAQFQELLDSADLPLTRVLPTTGPLSIVEAVPR